MMRIGPLSDDNGSARHGPRWGEKPLYLMTLGGDTWARPFSLE